MSEPSDVPPAIFERIEAICLALPDASLRSDRWAHAFEVRRRVFTFLLNMTNSDGSGVTIIALSADEDERRALLAEGHPYFPPSTGARRLGIVIDEDTDWAQLAELITDSYRLNAPKTLSALLDVEDS